MFKTLTAKTLTQIAEKNFLAINSLHFVEIVRNTEIEPLPIRLPVGTILAVISKFLKGKEYFFGYICNANLHSLDAVAVYKLNSDVKAFALSDKPKLGLTLEFLKEAMIKDINEYHEPFASLYQEELDRLEAIESERLIQEEQEQIIADQKIYLREQKRAKALAGLRAIAAEEARNELQRISVEQHPEVIETITKIVNEVADKIVLANYKLVDDYYNQAYLQAVQLEERLTAEFKSKVETELYIIKANYNENLNNIQIETNTLTAEIERKYKAAMAKLTKKTKAPTKVTIAGKAKKKPVKKVRK